MSDKDAIILRKIIRYADEAAQSISLLGVTSVTFDDDFTARNAVALCVLQIGELASMLSPDFLSQYNAIPWQQIKGMRNRVAHGYGEMRRDVLWDTAVEDLSELRAFCERALAESGDR
jgi:uncharacterized protein with HEPN domain